MPRLVVFVNGIDAVDGADAADAADAAAGRREMQARFVREQFPRHATEVFDVFDEDDGEVDGNFLLDKAQAIANRLHDLRRSNTFKADTSIVFAAHNIGAVVVKLVLLLAMENDVYNYLALQTMALHLVESPSFPDRRRWEAFLFRLLSAAGRPTANIASLASFIDKLPAELAHITTRFSALAPAYEVRHYNRPDDEVYDSSDDLWHFGDDGSRLLSVLDPMRASLRVLSDRFSESFRELIFRLRQPEAATGRLNPPAVDLQSMAWLEDHAVYKQWHAAQDTSLLAVAGERGSGMTHVASHVLYSLLAAAAADEPEAVFLSFGFDAANVNRSTERHLVASLIRQLLVLRPPTYTRILPLSSRYQFAEGHVPCAFLWRLFRYMLTFPGLSRVYIVVSAIDQCCTPVADTLAALAAFATQPPLPDTVPTKLFLTMSGNQSATDSMACLPAHASVLRLTLTDGEWRAVVGKVAVARIQRFVRRRPVWRGMEDAIVAHLSGSGNYLDSMLRLDMLEQSRLPSTPAGLRAYLGQPVPATDGVFAAVVKQVLQSDQATRALQWIYHAVRPLSPRELAAAMALSGLFSEDRGGAAAPAPVFDDLVQAVSWDLLHDLAGCLEPAVRVANEQVVLVHHAFRLYLERCCPAISAPDFHAKIVEQCIWFLAESARSEAQLSTPESPYPFLPTGHAYAMKHYLIMFWSNHLRLAGPAAATAQLCDTVVQFLEASVLVGGYEDEDEGEDGADEDSADKDSKNENGKDEDGKDEDGKDEDADGKSANRGEATEDDDNKQDASRSGSDVDAETTKKDEAVIKLWKDQDPLDTTNVWDDAGASKDAGAAGAHSGAADSSSQGRPPKNSKAPSLRDWVINQKFVRSWPPFVVRDALCLAIQLGLDTVARHMLRTIGLASDTVDATRRIDRSMVAAAFCGDLALVEEILTARKPCPEALASALMYASWSGHRAIVKRLLDEVADGDLVRSLKKAGHVRQHSLLYLAANSGHLDVVELLLESGHSLLATAHNASPVHAAARIGDAAILRTLARQRREEFEAAILLIDMKGINALQAACATGLVDVFDAVYEYAPPNLIHEADGKMSPLEICAEYGHLAVWKRLVASGADPLTGTPMPIPEDMNYTESVNLRSSEDANPTQIEVAARFGHEDLVAHIIHLLEAPPKPSAAAIAAERKRGGKSTKTGREGSEEKHKQQRGTGTEVGEEAQAMNELRQRILRSTLFEAVGVGCIRLVERLLPLTERDAHLDFNTLLLATGRGCLDVIKALVAAGISIKPGGDNDNDGDNDDDDGDGYNSLLDLAISVDYPDITRYLIDHGLRSQWDGSETSIQYAARCGYLLSLRMLLKVSTPEQVHHKSASMVTALEMAAQNCELESFRALLAWEEAHDAPETTRTPPSALVYAIESSSRCEERATFVEYLLAHGWDPNVGKGTSDIPLHRAVLAGEPRLVQMLLDNKADPDLTDDRHNAALHLVARDGRSDMVFMLLDKGADETAQGRDGRTPLLASAFHGQNKVFRILARLVSPPSADGSGSEGKGEGEGGNSERHRPKVDLDVTDDDGAGIIHYAIKDEGVLESLFEAHDKLGLKLDINRATKNGTTALMTASQEESLAVVERLLDKDADPNQKDIDGRAALHYAVARNERDTALCIEIIQSLAKHRADVNATGGPCGALLCYAMWQSWSDVSHVKALLEAGATADLQLPPYSSPLHLLTAASSTLADSTATLAPLLVQKGARLEATDSCGRTPLVHMVMHRRAARFAEPLLKLGADPNARDATGLAPLHFAVRAAPSAETAEALLNYKADVRALDAVGHSVLYHAALAKKSWLRSCYDTVLERLPEAEQPSQKAAALTAALKSGASDLVDSILADTGTDVNVPDANGWTGLDIALSAGLEDRVAHLTGLGAVRGTSKTMPTQLSQHDRHTDAFVSADGTEAGILEPAFARYHSEPLTGAARADSCVSLASGIFYYEVEILKLEENSLVAIGFSQEWLQLDEMVGWGDQTWGYHSDDGQLIANDADLDHGPTYGAGDVIGVAYDVQSQKLWFVKNGELAAVSWRELCVGEEGGDPRDDGEEADGRGKGEEETTNKDGDDGDGDSDSDNGSGASAARPKPALGEAADKRSRASKLRASRIAAAHLVGQLYPSVSFQQHAADEVRVRVKFGPPFAYALPDAVPSDAVVQARIRAERDRQASSGHGGSDRAASSGE